MQIIQKTTNEMTGTKKAIIIGKNGIYVRWQYKNGEVKISKPQADLIEASMLMACESEKELKNLGK